VYLYDPEPKRTPMRLATGDWHHDGTITKTFYYFIPLDEPRRKNLSPLLIIERRRVPKKHVGISRGALVGEESFAASRMLRI
jgi:hypothetical protein